MTTTASFELREARLRTQIDNCDRLETEYLRVRACCLGALTPPGGATRPTEGEVAAAGHALYVATVKLDQLYREMVEAGEEQRLVAGIGADFEKPDGECTGEDTQAQLDHRGLARFVRMARLGTRDGEQHVLDENFACFCYGLPSSKIWLAEHGSVLCYCCRRAVALTRKVLLRQLVTDESREIFADEPDVRDEEHLHTEFVCEQCYSDLDTTDGIGQAHDRKCELDPLSRSGKAPSFTPAQFVDYLRAEAADR
jgi:hypothetical protein